MTDKNYEVEFVNSKYTVQAPSAIQAIDIAMERHIQAHPLVDRKQLDNEVYVVRLLKAKYNDTH